MKRISRNLLIFLKWLIGGLIILEIASFLPHFPLAFPTGLSLWAFKINSCI